MKLQYRVTLFIFAILLSIGMVGAIVMLFWQRQTTLSQFEESALTLAATLHDSLEHDMIEANREHIQDAVSRIASGALINEVVILSNAQKVYASGKSSEVGQTRNDEEIARALSSGETVTRTEKMYGKNEVCVIMPVMNKPECYTCHGSEAKVLGAIEIGLDKESLDDQIENQTLIMALIGGLTFISVGMALSFMLSRAVVKPLSKLAASASKIAQGDFSARAEVERQDEVGMVAIAFNEMVERLEQRTHDLENSKAELEQRVQERTQQIQQMMAIRGRLLERLISAQAKERRRVAREPDDEVGQTLSDIMTDLARTIQASPGEVAEPQDEKYGALTLREKEVLRLAAAGQTNREIAERLFLNTRTVEKYRQSLMYKLGLHRREELTKYALRKGLIGFET